MLAYEDQHRWRRVVLKMPSSELPAAQKVVLMALATFADYRDGTGAHPGEELLATMCDVSIPTVRRAVAAGIRLQLIDQTDSANPRKHLAAVYQLTLPAVSRDHQRHLEPVSTDHQRSVNNSSTDHQRSLEQALGDQNEPVLGITGDTPPKPFTTTTGVLRNWGTSPEAPEPVATHTIDPPSRFCPDHPQGTTDDCGPCANHRTARKAWQAAQAERDAATELAAKHTQRQRSSLIAACKDCDQYGRIDIGPDQRGNDRLDWCTHPRLHLQLVAGDG